MIKQLKPKLTLRRAVVFHWVLSISLQNRSVYSISYHVHFLFEWSHLDQHWCDCWDIVLCSKYFTCSILSTNSTSACSTTTISTPSSNLSNQTTTYSVSYFLLKNEELSMLFCFVVKWIYQQRKRKDVHWHFHGGVYLLFIFSRFRSLPCRSFSSLFVELNLVISKHNNG